jgi:hypothetical protein
MSISARSMSRPARQAGADGADWNTENRGDLFVAHTLEPEEQDYLALSLRQAGDSPFEVAQLQSSPDIIGGGDGHIFDRDGNPFARRAADIIDVLVVKNGKEPGAQIGSWLPQMLLGDGAKEAALHQVIGPRCIVGQSPRVTS